MKVLLIDNYDSFTYNLAHLLEELNCAPIIRYNDEIRLGEANEFHKILLSPGPGTPSEAGIMPEIIQTYAPTKSILGVCLGMQAISEVFGGKLLNLETVFHGSAKPVKITVPDECIYKGIEDEFIAGRYHSWVVEPPLPSCLEITAVDREGHIMSLRHKSLDVRGVQFHPESYMTNLGKQILSNWLWE
ncbi:MAG: aminodeoxychorismate/anthranilate synthase component II [Moheibacter sp.]